MMSLAGLVQAKGWGFWFQCDVQVSMVSVRSATELKVLLVRALRVVSRVRLFETGHGLVVAWGRVLMGREPAKSAADKMRIVLAVLRGEVSVAEAARREGASAVSVAKWRDQFLAGGRHALEAGARQGPSAREERLAAEIEQLNTALGEAHMELRLWKKGGLLHGPSTSSTPSDARRA